MKFRGGGATRKTGSCCDLDLCHNLKMTCHSSFDEKIECHPELDSGSIKIGKDSGSGAGMTGIESNILRPAIRSDEGSRMSRTPSRHSDESQSLSMPVNSICHSELVSESLNKEIDSGSGAGMTKPLPVYLPCHSELAAKSVETGSKRDFMPLPGDSESINADRNNLRRIDRTDQSSRNAAFTLAEVLITLGIIGIVAAITLPSLIGRWQEKVRQAQFKKAFNIINVATQKTTADLGYVPGCYYWAKGDSPYPALECERQEDGNCIYKYPDGDTPSDYHGPNVDCKAFYDAFEKNLNIIQRCEHAEEDGCTVHYKGSDTILKESDDSLTEEEINAATTGDSAKREENFNKLKAIVLIDGITILDYRNYHPFVDINGKKGPNKWGYDLFRFVRRGSSKKGIFIDTDVGQTVDKGGKTAAEMYEQSFLH